MKLFTAFCAASLLATVNAYAFLQILPENSKYPGQCYLKDKNLLIPVGGTADPLGECVSYSCSTHESGYLLNGIGCGTIGYDSKKCHLTEENLTLPYPKCCPKLSCVKE